MADLIAKLKLDNTNWDININKSKQNIKKFETDSKQSIGSFDGVVNKVGGSLGKFAGLIGIGFTAFETLNKSMESNQTTSDLFHNNINAAKDSVDLFFKSLVTGDFSVFNDGILGAFSNLKTLSSMLDELADKKLSLSFIRAEDLKDIEQFEQIAKDLNKSLSDRKDAAQNMQGVVNNLNKKTKETADFSIKTLNQNYAAKSGLKIDNEDLKYFTRNTNFSGDLTTNANNAYKEYVKLNKEAEKLKANSIYDVKNYGINPERKYQKEYNEKKKVSELFKKDNEFLIKQGWLTEENDVDRNNLVQTLNEQLNVEREIISLQKRVDETARSVQVPAAAKAAGLSKKEKDDINIQSLEQFSTNSIKEQVDNIIIPQIQSILDKNKFDFNILLHLNDSEVEAEANDLSGSLTDLNQKINAANEAYQYATNDNQRDALKERINNLNNEKDAIEGISNENDIYAQGLSGIGNVMGLIGSVTDSSTAAFLGYGATLISTVASALPSIISLTTALTAKAAAESAGSAAKVPVVGWVMAIASIASIVAAMAAIPKFENGGIIGGNSFAGDKIMARVNSGEMILNKSQQSNLFGLLNNGNTNNSINNNVIFKIQGKELIGVLNNYTNKTNKY